MRTKETRPNHDPWKWKWIALGLSGVVGVALVVGVVAASLDSNADRDESAGSDPARQVDNDEPNPQAIAACNRYAATARSQPGDVVRDGAIGGALGAGVGAAGGAIVDGGEGAGKGAGIGAIVGAAAGTLHGLDEANRRNEAAEAAYRSCMAERGY